jgi:hypothetical protein
MCLKNRKLGMKCLRLTLDLIMQLIMAVIGMMVTFCIQSWQLFYIAKYHQLLQSIVSDIKNQHSSLTFSNAPL